MAQNKCDFCRLFSCLVCLPAILLLGCIKVTNTVVYPNESKTY